MSVIGAVHRNGDANIFEPKDFKNTRAFNDSIFWIQQRKALNRTLSKNIEELLELATYEKAREGANEATSAPAAGGGS